MRIGLAEVPAFRTLREAERIARDIKAERVRQDKQEMREFAIDYQEKFFFRLWNVGLKEAFMPKDVADLTEEVIDDYLSAMYRYGWKSNYAWRDLATVKEVIELGKVTNASTGMDPSTIFINQEQARVLNLR